MRLVILFGVLMAAWLLMSGHYTPLLVTLGVLSCAFATYMAHLVGGTDSEGLPLHIMKRLPAYLVWLMREIISSNIATAKIILRNTPDPEIFTTPASQKTEAGIATYANSITLTPGTVTVDITQNTPRQFIVHALHPDFTADVTSGDMDNRVTALEPPAPSLKGTSA